MTLLSEVYYSMLSDQSILQNLRRIVIALFTVYLFIYPFAIVLVALDKVPVWGTWRAAHS